MIYRCWEYYLCFVNTTHTEAIDYRSSAGNNNLFAGLLRDSVPQLPEHQQGGEPGQRGGQDPGGDAGHPPGGDQQAGLRHHVNTVLKSVNVRLQFFSDCTKLLMMHGLLFSVRLTAVSQSVLSLLAHVVMLLVPDVLMYRSV